MRFNALTVFLSDKDCFEHVCICLHQSTVFSSLKLLQTFFFFFFFKQDFFGAKQKNSINLTHPVSSSTVRVVLAWGVVCILFLIIIIVVFICLF